MINIIRLFGTILLVSSIGYANNQQEATKGGNVNKHEKINYVEFPAKDIEAVKTFFTTVFGWSFVDYGPEYTSFSNSGLEGGFFKSDLSSSSEKGSALIVLYSEELEATQSKIEKAGGKIIKPIFSFPGGRRFHFTDPNGNEYAVWSE
jgi:predicted enzyme related to lactoylglutathione lyase